MVSLDKTYKTFMMLKYLLILMLITGGGIPAPLSADNGNIPVDLQAKLFLTALTYDKNLEKRASSQLDIALLYFPWSAPSKEAALSFSKTLEMFKDKKISGRSFNVSLLTYNGDFGLKEKLADKHVDVLFIAGGEEPMVREITKITQSEKILSCSNRAEYVTTCGVTMAVGLKDNKPKIYLNLTSAKREGADFSAKFLRVAEIVDREEKD
jgi:hypothetical protein